MQQSVPQRCDSEAIPIQTAANQPSHLLGAGE